MAEQCTFDFKLLDESFDPQDVRSYGLAILFNETSFSCSILDFKRNKFIGLIRCIPNVVNPEDGQQARISSPATFLHSVSSAIPWLDGPFKMVKIAYDGKNSTLVPSSLFEAGELDRIYRFNFSISHDEVVFADHLMPLDAWQVYAVSESILEPTRNLFPKNKIVHSTSLLIESVWINYKNRINAPHVFLNVREHLFDLMVFDGQQMIFFNTFPFQNPEDVAYYLIFMMEQLSFNPETTPLILLGSIETGDALSDLLHRYVRNTTAGLRNEAYRYSYILNQLPPQACFSLLNFFSCGL
jgi:hypothetical protein